MKAELITNTNSDLTVCNAARVSFNKESTEFTYRKDKPKGSDEGLLNYLAKNNHWTPFAHCRETFYLNKPLYLADLNYTDIAGMVWEDSTKTRHSIWGWANLLHKRILSAKDHTVVNDVLCMLYPEASKAMGLRMIREPLYATLDRHDERRRIEDNPDFIDVTMRETIPIFIARQRFKHMVGFIYNEVSRRYVDDPPEFHVPEEWRSRPDGSIKQGSGSQQLCDLDRPLLAMDGRGGMVQETDIHRLNNHLLEQSARLYRGLVESGVAPEQARMALPQSMMTSYYVTAPMTAWARAYHQRIDSHAQREIQDLARQWDTIMTTTRPGTWSDLVDE